MFNYINNGNYNDDYKKKLKDQAYETIRDLIHDGIETMRKGVSDSYYKIWEDYSIKMVDLALKNLKPELVSEYMRTISYSINQRAFDKMNIAIEKLIDILGKIK